MGNFKDRWEGSNKHMHNEEHKEEFVEVIQMFPPPQSVVPIFHFPASLAINSKEGKCLLKEESNFIALVHLSA